MARTTIFELNLESYQLQIEYSSLSTARMKYSDGDYAGAIYFYNLAIESDRQDSRAYLGRGNCHQVLGNYFDAIRDYNAALAIDPSCAEGFYRLGLVFDLLGRRNLALFNYNRSIKIDPGYGEALVSRSFAHFDLHRFDLAIADAQAALEAFTASGNTSRAKDASDSIAMLSAYLVECS